MRSIQLNSIGKWLLASALTTLVACNSSSSVTVPDGTSSGDGGESSNSNGDEVAYILPTDRGPGKAATMASAWKSSYYLTVEDQVDELKQYYDPKVNGSARIIWQGGGSVCTDPNTKTPIFCTVSEGIGYGMLIAYFSDDMDMLNRLWKYAKAWRTSSSVALMDWEIKSFWEPVGNGSATDADFDIATALLLAYEKTKDTDYLDDAILIAHSIYDYEVNPSNLLVRPGNTTMWVEAPGNDTYNPSYISPVALRLFAKYDDGRDWNAVVDANMNFLKKLQDAGDGLWPDWVDGDGNPKIPENGDGVKNYDTFGKESVRIPWRLAWDYMWFGDSRSRDMLNRAAAYVIDASGNDPEALKSGYLYSEALGNPNSRVPTTAGNHYTGGYCALAVANPELQGWMDNCFAYFNTRTTISGLSYYTHIVMTMYSQLLNGQYVKPDGI